jgi:hypothetical protein
MSIDIDQRGRKPEPLDAHGVESNATPVGPCLDIGQGIRSSIRLGLGKEHRRGSSELLRKLLCQRVGDGIRDDEHVAPHFVPRGRFTREVFGVDLFDLRDVMGTVRGQQPEDRVFG